MNILRELITARAKMAKMRRTIVKLRLENQKLKKQIGEKKTPTVAERTMKKEVTTPERVLSEYLFGKENAQA